MAILNNRNLKEYSLDNIKLNFRVQKTFCCETTESMSADEGKNNTHLLNEKTLPSLYESIEDPNIPNEDPNIPNEDPNIPKEDPIISKEDPNIHIENPNVSTEDPNVLKEDPNILIEEPHIPKEDPNIPIENPHIPIEDPDIKDLSDILSFTDYDPFHSPVDDQQLSVADEPFLSLKDEHYRSLKIEHISLKDEPLHYTKDGPSLSMEDEPYTSMEDELSKSQEVEPSLSQEDDPTVSEFETLLSSRDESYVKPSATTEFKTPRTEGEISSVNPATSTRSVLSGVSWILKGGVEDTLDLAEPELNILDCSTVDIKLPR